MRGGQLSLFNACGKDHGFCGVCEHSRRQFRKLLAAAIHPLKRKTPPRRARRVVSPNRSFKADAGPDAD